VKKLCLSFLAVVFCAAVSFAAAKNQVSFSGPDGFPLKGTFYSAGQLNSGSLGMRVPLVLLTTVRKSRNRFIAPAAVAAAAILGLVQPAHSQNAAISTITPFAIHVPESDLAELKRRLSQARFADEPAGIGWDYGTNLMYLRSLVDYWRLKYDWRAQERRLNEFHQFKTNIQGLGIHFIHEKSKDPNATPLLLLNGWPSSIVEYEKVIGPLTNPTAYGGRAEDSFNVVIPSMPGFGFSEKPKEKGYDPQRISEIWIELMRRLGYTRYIVHGSDWGNGIATRIALKDEAHVAALHLAGCGGAPMTNDPQRAQGPNSAVDAAHNLGYQEIQSTKPQTLGYALSDSPLGLASWIIEKWYGWSDHDGDVEKVFTKDELLTNIMIYWLTNSGASSTRIYYESRHMLGGLAPNPFPRPDGYVKVPTGCSSFPWQYDRRAAPANADSPEARKAAEARYNVVHFTTMPHGGHFPALEQPKLWLDDIRAFHSKTR
jgi:pimeloyl-ACP methyl ester carboxylesterase